MAQLDVRRGERDRSSFVRSVLFGDAEGRERYRRFMAGTPLAELKAPVTQQDAPSASIEEGPLPAPPVKESIVLPPVGKPDASGMHYRWDPRSPTVGTLQFAKAGEEWRELDLIGVELSPRTDGTTVLYYADRSRVRTAPNEDRGMVRESGRGDLERQRKIEAALWPGTEDMGK